MTHRVPVTAVRRTTAAVGVTALLLGGSTAVADTAPEDDADCAPSTATPVTPLEQVDIGQRQVLGLLPSDDQTYVTELDHDPAWYEESVQRVVAEGGPDLSPDGLALLALQTWHTPDQVDPNLSVAGLWRVDCGPSRISVEVNGEQADAQLVELTSRPGWGGYHLDPEIVTSTAEILVTAYDQDGEVFEEIDFVIEVEPAAHGTTDDAPRSEVRHA